MSLGLFRRHAAIGVIDGRRTTSPGIFDVLAVLGRQECLARLGRCFPPPVLSPEA